MGRPTKIEGNPEHPVSLGATDPFAQASILGLYDPDRSQVVTRRGRDQHLGQLPDDAQSASWTAASGRQGDGLRILTGDVTSPTLADQIQKVLKAFPEAKWHQYEPVARDGLRAGARLAFGEDVETQYHLDQADVILALDADFLARPGASAAGPRVRLPRAVTPRAR